MDGLVEWLVGENGLDLLNGNDLMSEYDFWSNHYFKPGWQFWDLITNSCAVIW